MTGVLVDSPGRLDSALFSSMSSPLVSVIVPAYCHRAFLPARVDSILSQSVSDIELIILDDASGDGTAEWLRGQRFPVATRTLINNARIGSPVEQWSRGLEFAQGEFVWIAEADDLARREFLGTLLGSLAGDPTVGMALCQSAVIDKRGRIIDSHRRWTEDAWAPGGVQNGSTAVVRALSVRNTIPNVSACLFRRSALQNRGWKQSNLRLCGDWHAYAWILRTYSVAYHAEELNLHRRHARSVRATIDRSWERVEEMYRVLAWLHEMFPEAADRLEEARTAQFDSFLHLLDVMIARGIPPTENTLRLALVFDPRFVERLEAHRPRCLRGINLGPLRSPVSDYFLTGRPLPSGLGVNFRLPHGLFRIAGMELASGIYSKCDPQDTFLTQCGWKFTTPAGLFVYSPDGVTVRIESREEAPLNSSDCKLLISPPLEPSTSARVSRWRVRRNPFLRWFLFGVETRIGHRVHFLLWRLMRLRNAFAKRTRSAAEAIGGGSA
jgi:hypothetical protein